MNKQQLASKIWAGADNLRGTISASNYKDYMLGLIFYKFLSEKEEKYLKEKLYFEDSDIKDLVEEDTATVENCRSNIGYFISYDNLFSYWIEKGTDFQIADIRTALSAFDRLIGKRYKKVYNGIFDTLNKGLEDFGSSDAERTKKIRKLVVLIDEIPTDGNQDYDVLGFVYEFLLKNFAANAGKAGEFYTPYEASQVMSEIIANHLKDKDEISIYDPTSGSGSLLLNIGKSVSKYLNDPNHVKYYAQELIPETYNLTRMNLIMRDILPDNIVIRNGDTLEDDWPFFDDNDKQRTYDPVFVDACSSNPPYSQNWKPADINAESDVRFKDYGVAPNSKADYAFLLHNLYHLKPDGIMTIVLPHGTLFRGGEERKIRKNLIEKDKIEAIIGLPANCFFGTGIATIIMILKKNRNNDDILFVDASKGFMKDGNKNKLRAKDTKKIVDTVIERKTIEKYSRLVSKEEVVANDYNLNISRYVDSNETADYQDIYASVFGGIPNVEINKLNVYWDAIPLLRTKIFDKQDDAYSVFKTSNIKQDVLEDQNVKDYILSFKNKFSSFPDYLKSELIDNVKEISIHTEEAVIAGKIKELLKDVSLVDYYDAYQILDDNWKEIALDIEAIQTEGMIAVKEVDARVIQKKNKQKELIDVQDGWMGRILPFDLVDEVYFKDAKDEIDALAELKSSLESEKKSLLDSIDPIDKAELLKEDSEDIEAKKLNKVISKLKKALKQGAEFEEGSYEDIIIKVNAVNEALKKAKKDIKEKTEKLETETKIKIESLSDEESIELLQKKWIDPLCNSINELPKEEVISLIDKIENLDKKYKTTYIEVVSNIEDSKISLSEMIDELTGNEYDMKGLLELKKLFGGNADGKQTSNPV